LIFLEEPIEDALLILLDLNEVFKSDNSMPVSSGFYLEL
jgi:hypothetical protein